MNDENARRFALRLTRDRALPPITEADVEEYRRVHYPHHAAEQYIPGQRGRPPPVPGDNYVAALSHERFHKWFGTVCDETCPHARYELPYARVRQSWWRRLLRLRFT